MVESKAERRAVYERFEATKDAVMSIEAYIETHPGRFSVAELCGELGVSHDFTKRIVESHPLVRIIDEKLKMKKGPHKRYLSVAVPPAPTPEGLEEEADIIRRFKETLGREAREDFYELIRVRSLCLHQGKRRQAW